MDPLLHATLSNSLLAALLALVAAAVARVWRRPALAHGLWLLVLLKLLTPPLVSLPLPWPVRAQPSPATAARPAREPRPATEVPGNPEPASRPKAQGFSNAPALVSEPPFGKEPAEATPLAGLREPADEAGLRETTAVEATTGLPPAAGFVSGPILVIWLTGSVLWAMLACGRLLRFRRCLRLAQPAPEAVQARTRRLALRLGLTDCPDACFVPAPVSPMLWAMAGPPRLVLPEALWACLGPNEQDTLLVHELAHLRRRDHWVRWLEVVALALYWWHPLVWWARHQLQDAEEQCCDAWVVWALPEAASAYAGALVASVAFLSQARPALPVGASGAGRTHPVKRRLTMILCGTCPRALSWPAFLVLLTVGAVLLPLRPTWAEPAQLDEPARAEPTPDARPQAKRPALEPRAEPAQTKQPRLEWRSEPPAPKPDAAPKLRGWSRTAAPGDLEAAKDEVELMQVQVGMRTAELQEVEVRLKAAQRRVSHLKQMRERGAVSEDELSKEQEAVEILTVQMEPKRAQIREAEIRLRQAKRRLDGFRQVERSGNWAENLFEERVKGVGPVPRGSQIMHSFRLTNRLDTPVRIERVASSGSFATVVPTETDLAPGQSGDVQVRLDTSQLVGPKTVAVYISFDRPEPAEVRLALTLDSQEGNKVGTSSAPRNPTTESRQAADRARLQALEKQIADLMAEVKKLRLEMQPRQ